MNHLQTTQEIYDAFGRSDIPAISARLAETVDWEYVPGPEQVP